MSNRAMALPQKAITKAWTPIHRGLLQRKCACGGSSSLEAECAECSKNRLSLQRATRNAEPQTRNSNGVPPIVHEVLRSPGQPLEPATRAFMEPRFGHDFSQVRVHADARAAESTRAVNALAYTVGGDIFFGKNGYQPGSPEGNQIIAHELTHVIQQQEFSNPPRQNLTLGQPEDASEQEADQIASTIIQTRTPAVPGYGGPTVSLADRGTEIHRLVGSFVIQRQVPTGITLKETKPFGHADLKSDDDKKKFLTNLGAVTLMQLTPTGDYTAGQKKGECTKEFLTEVSNTCPAHDFCTGNKCLEVGRFGTSGDPPTGMMVTDGPDTFIDRHVTRLPTSFLEGSGKDKCSVVCHQHYKYRTEPDKKYHDLGSFYIIRNFKAGKYTPAGGKDAVNITTGEVKKVPAGLEAPSKEKFAKDIAPGLVKSGALLEAPPVP
jgi:hypothetical protein